MQVKAAMIMMSIMGCNDGGTHCVPLATTDAKWPTVAACDKESEASLQKYANAHYPMIIAVCQSPQMAATSAPTLGAPADGGLAGTADATENNEAINQPGSISTAKVEPTLSARPWG